MSSSSSSKDLTATAQQVLKDPKLLEKLVERVYELMRNDLRTTQERISGYSPRRD
ncbi:hypothetical protein IFO70_21180 [Phormidium tenue FACHB-886]|nr:hypothetical protein [Phormidium tenue FACHB-886]